MYHIGGNTYQLVKDHKNGWNFEVFRERYSEVLDRYDYIVGDWGYNQLRLKGFFKENNSKGTKDASISLLHDYLNEYCNFGCAYFIIEKLASKKGQPFKEGEPSDGFGLEPDKGPESDKPKDPDFKPRQHQHYYRAKDKNPEGKPKGGPERGGGQVPNEQRAKEVKEPKGREPQESRSKGQEHRSKGQEMQSKGQELRSKGQGQQRRGDPESKGKQNPQQEQKGKQQSQSGKGKNLDRSKDRERNRDKEKAEPLA